ncbi:glycosyltransferase family 2 protein [Vicingus serpentipes]|uniref:glycosyltransferase family 2 protein n=1 Tax=Vicingus serpentipes TaxID=1926625 RepID=UPI0014772096|nr:glycosyltransferase family 2 protein [Vicingus serpentipes]
MKLSIIIVNYNVKNFLDQCLNSVFKGITKIEAEVFVVDNISTDGSVEMVQKKYPSVKLIANEKNVGFSIANNQAIKIAKGEYILLLNPDTVVEEDTFEKCIQFSDNQTELGGLGVKMIDGNGIFLPESKRGLPTPSVSFYKIFGLSSLFPKSKKFAKYHLGYLNEDETNEIEILSGAYMWMRKSVLDEIGYLDEGFFMYGEDIDLSYRIIQAGYKNYYFPKTKIIHYKGESTKKGSINYVFVFYNAMIIFSKKHFTKNAKAFSFFINIAIYLRAALALIVRFINYFKLPLIDTGFILLILVLLNFLKPYLGFPNQIEINNEYGLLNVLLVVMSFITGQAILKGYTQTVRINRTLWGMVLGTVLLVGVNAIFPKEYSFSNKFLISILSGIIFIIPSTRFTLNYFNKLKLRKNNNKSIIVTGDKPFIEKISNLVEKQQTISELLKINPSNNCSTEDEDFFIGKKYQLKDIAQIYNTSEVIFSSNNMTYKDIIEEMSQPKNKYIDYKISLRNELLIGGSTVEKI